MLDERDIQLLSKLLDEKLDAKLDEKLDTKLDEKLDAKFAAQKKEISSEILTVIESEVTPKLRLLAEGHDAILKKLQELESLKNC